MSRGNRARTGYAEMLGLAWYIGDNSGGLAIYLANRQRVSLARDTMPPKKAFTKNDSRYFEKHNGYLYADKFIEFLERDYGRESVLELARTGDYAAIAGKGLNRLYDEWAEFLRKNYP